jgi:hypothetical protein
VKRTHRCHCEGGDLRCCKKLEPIPQFKATAKLGEFLETRFSESF